MADTADSKSAPRKGVRVQVPPGAFYSWSQLMITLGFGYCINVRFTKVKNGNVFDNGHDRWNKKFFCFDVPDMSMEEFDDLYQRHDHPDREWWDDLLDEACCVGTTDSCDIAGHNDVFLWVDYNKETSDENLCRACEILRNYFIAKGMACSEVKELQGDKV